MKHEFVVGIELIPLNADHRPIVGHANQEIAALGIAMVFSTALVTP